MQVDFEVRGALHSLVWTVLREENVRRVVSPKLVVNTGTFVTESSVTVESRPRQYLRRKVLWGIGVFIVIACLVSISVIRTGKEKEPVVSPPARSDTVSLPPVPSASLPIVLAPQPVVVAPQPTNDPDHLALSIPWECSASSRSNHEHELTFKETNRDETGLHTEVVLLQHFREENTLLLTLKKLHIAGGSTSRAGVQIGFGRFFTDEPLVTRMTGAIHRDEPGCVYLKTSFSF